jgi:hypothetical protein
MLQQQADSPLVDVWILQSTQEEEGPTLHENKSYDDAVTTYITNADKSSTCQAKRFAPMRKTSSAKQQGHVCGCRPQYKREAGCRRQDGAANVDIVARWNKVSAASGTKAWGSETASCVLKRCSGASARERRH